MLCVTLVSRLDFNKRFLIKINFYNQSLFRKRHEVYFHFECKQWIVITNSYVSFYS